MGSMTVGSQYCMVVQPACFVVHRAWKLSGQGGFLQDELSGQARYDCQLFFILDLKRRYKGDTHRPVETLPFP